MTDAAAGIAEAAPPADASTAATQAPTSGAFSFADYVKTLPDEDQAHVAKKNWKDFPDAIKAHRSAESAIGAKVDLPKAGDEAALKAHLQKLGAPADGKYALTIPDGVTIDEGLRTGFEGIAAQAGLLPQQAQALLNWWNEQAAAAGKGMADASAAEQAAKAKVKTDAMAAYETTLGKDQFEAKLGAAQRAAEFAGFMKFDAILNAIEDTEQSQAFIEGFAKLGDLIGTEDQHVDGHGRGGPPSAPLPLANRLYPNLK